VVPLSHFHNFLSSSFTHNLVYKLSPPTPSQLTRTMTPVIKLLVALLLTTYTHVTALHADSHQQQPLNGPVAVASREIQPLQVGRRDTGKSPETNLQISCKTSPRAQYVQGEGRVVSTLLTFKYPKAKFCWLEFLAPAPKGSGRLRVALTQDALPSTCPANPKSPGWPNEIGYWVVLPNGGVATWQDRSGNDLNNNKSPCKPAGTLQGVEIIPPQSGPFDLEWIQEEKKGVRLMYSD